MHLWKLLIGLVLILLSLSMAFNSALVMAVAPATIQVSVGDLNGDGLQDIKFTVIKDDLALPGVQINVSVGISSGLTLFAGETDNNGSCLFYDVPGGTYEWIASDGVPNNGEITVPTSVFCLTESEAVAWQTIALSWMGESQDADRAFFEKMSQFVGFDPTGNPFSSPVGPTLLEYSQKTYQWLDKLQSYIVNLDRPELNLLNKMILPFKSVAAGFFGDGISGVDFSQIANVTLQLILNSTDRIMTYAFAALYPNGNVAGSVHDILKMPVASGLDMTSMFPTEMIIAGFQHCYEPRFLNPSVLWDSSIVTTDGSFQSRSIAVLNMTVSVIPETLEYLDYARSAVGFLTKLVPAAATVTQLLGGIVSAVQVFYGAVITIMTVFHWWETYPTLDIFVRNILQGNPVLLTEVAMVVYNILLVAYGAYYLYSLLVGVVLGAAYTVVGLLLGIIGWILWWWYRQVVYNQQIDTLEGGLGGNLTELLRVRQALGDMNVTSLRQTAGVYQRSAGVLSAFAEIAHKRSSTSGLEQFFSDSAALLKAHAEQESELANAVGNATVSLDNLLQDYLSWNGTSGQIRAYLDGYNITTVTYSHSGETFTNDAVVGTKDGSTYVYSKKHVTADNLDGSLSFVSRGNISQEWVHLWGTHYYWTGWAWDYLPQEKDSRGSPIAVFYNIGDANPIQYDEYDGNHNLNASYAHNTAPFETFYQYKFQFEEIPGSDTLQEWIEQINNDSMQFKSDYRRLQYALDAPVYEESSISKPHSGNSWTMVNDSSSFSGSVMMASNSSSNGECLFGPYITLTSAGESMLGKPYLATFSLKVSSNASFSVVASIDVAYNDGVILQSMQVKASDFRYASSWQDFSLPFTAPVSMTAGLEFRVSNYNNGVADLFFDKISITRGWNATTLYAEAAYNKPRSSNGSWSVINDPSSLSGKVMMASSLTQNNGWLYGPYIDQSFDGDSLLGNACIATFRLKVSSNQHAAPVARIDIGYNAGSVLQSMYITGNDFASSNAWQDFSLTFIVPNNLTAGLEFRTHNLNNGLTDLFADTITVVRWENSSVAFIEGAFNKQHLLGDTSWPTVSDSSSFSGLVMKASVSSSNGHWLYGPYITSDLAGQPLSGKPYVAIFRLKVSYNVSPNTVAYVDVDYNAGMILQSMQIRATDFVYPYVWQDFKLSFIVPSSLSAGLEFRVQNLNGNITDLYVDTITAVQGWTSSDAYVEAAYNKPQTGSWQIYGPWSWERYYNSSWSRVLDSSSTSGLVMEASNSSGRNDWLYGPYIMSDWNGQSMLGKPYTATFGLKVSSNTSPSAVIYIDIGYNAGSVLQSMYITGNDFASSNAWQDFSLTFIVPNNLTAGLEFRTHNLNGVADVYVDRITVDQGWNSSTTYLESAYNKPQSGNSWIGISDSASFSGEVMMASSSSPNGGCLFGPYILVGWDQESMLGRAYTATFRLKVSSNLAASDVASIDVACNAGTILQSLSIKATDFVSSNAWQDFSLTFIAPSSLAFGLEFRVINFNHSTTNIFADYISINQA